jgi:biotin transporter BioY
MSSSGDYQVAACAAGFTIGFGFLTTVRAIHQTKANRNPWKSAYIYMIWGEILANLALGVLCWLWLKDMLHNGYAELHVST